MVDGYLELCNNMRKAMVISDKIIKRIKDDTVDYINWLRNIKPIVYKNKLLAGQYTLQKYPVYHRLHDNLHYPLGMKKLLKYGFFGISALAKKNAKKFKSNQAEYLLLIGKVYDEIIETIKKYEEIAREKKLIEIELACHNLTIKEPKHFVEACQLYWFSALFRIGTSTIGRIDQHLFPYYKYDKKNNKIDQGYAERLIAELLYRYERRGNKRGDTLQNITLSGIDINRKDKTNDLTYMILEEYLKTKYIEPKINIRVNKKSSERLLNLTAKLQINGSGNCTIYNDDAIPFGLSLYGRKNKIAYEYCSDGCSEIILDGIGETAFRYIDCVKAVEHTIFNGDTNIPSDVKLQYYSNDQEYIDVKPPVEKGLKTGKFIEFETFDKFYKAYLKQIKYQIDIVLGKSYNNEEYPIRLFTSATMPDVLEKAIDPFSNKNCIHTYGLFIGSLGTAANCIAAVKYLIYDNNILSRNELIEALKENFKNEYIQRLCLDAPKFGNDDDFVDNIARDIAKKFAFWVKNRKDGIGRPIVPGLYNHLFNHTAYNVGATPDGRKYGDNVGEHLSPTPGTAIKGPTAIINSISKVNTKEQIFGSTLHLNIPKVALMGAENPSSLLKYINKAFCLKGCCVMNINVLDSEKLIEAQKHPEKYNDLIVRVWGFSYYFNKLSKEMQDHVIARSKVI